MTPEKVLEVVSRYEEFLKDFPPARMPTSLSIREVPWNISTTYSHLHWMCGEICKLIEGQTVDFNEPEKLEKVMRWLGFIQGFLYAVGDFSIDEMCDHNREKT